MNYKTLAVAISFTVIAIVQNSVALAQDLRTAAGMREYYRLSSGSQVLRGQDIRTAAGMREYHRLSSGSQVLRAQDPRTASGMREYQRLSGGYSPEQLQKMRAEEQEMQPKLNSWNAGVASSSKLDWRKKYTIKKLGANNVLKIAKAEARKNKAEFENVFAMGFICGFYGLSINEVEGVAEKMGVRKELKEIVSVVNYLQ